MRSNPALYKPFVPPPMAIMFAFGGTEEDTEFAPDYECVHSGCIPGKPKSMLAYGGGDTSGADVDPGNPNDPCPECPDYDDMSPDSSP